MFDDIDGQKETERTVYAELTEEKLNKALACEKALAKDGILSNAVS